MIYKTEQSIIDNYFSDTDHVSQSSLKQLLKGVNAYLKTADNEKSLYYTEKGHFIIGSAVDTILSMGYDEFQKQYFVVADDSKPGDKSLSLMQYIFDTQTEGMSIHEINNFRLSSVSDTAIIEACNINEFQKRYKSPALIKAVYKYEDYFNNLCIAFGKQIITFEDKNKIDNIVSSFENSKWSYLFDDSLKDDIDNDLYFQLPIYTNISGLKVKGLLDLVIVDHKRKTISIVDFKTMSEPVIKFPKSAHSYRYDIQAAWYIKLLGLWLVDKPEFKGYTFSEFNFLVESTTFINGAVMYNASKDFIKGGKYGTGDLFALEYESNYGRQLVKIRNAKYGWSYALDLYIWHIENGFDQDKEIVVNNNILTLE